MTVKKLFDKICIDGIPVENVLQVTIDEEKTTVVYEHPGADGDHAQRVITVESEAVTFV